MDVVRLGRTIRALRIRRRWRQADLAGAVGRSQSLVARVERGGADRVTLRLLEQVAARLGARLTVRIDWNGEAADRLLDADHAAIVDAVLRDLRVWTWEASPEVTFAIDGERGSIDVLAWHPGARVVLVVEVKSVVPDVQATLATLDRKVRLAKRIATGRGWAAAEVATVIVISDSTTSRRRVAKHAATFDARVPARTRAVRHYLADPTSAPPVRGIWFLPVRTGASSRERVVRRGRPS